MLDIVQLIEKNPITRLNSNYQTVLINKIKERFTENQQHLFLASFYTFLNYHPKNDFVIEFEKIWKWLGFQRKEFCKRVLTKHFIEEIDYKIVLLQPEENPDTHINLGGRPKEDIYMNINTFKKLCLKSNTKKADEIHDYFIKMEETFQEVINEESNELKLQLQQKDKLLIEKDKQIQKITKLKVRKWYDMEPGHTVYGYISNEDNKDNKDSNLYQLITIGKSKDIKHRESNYLTHNQHGEMFCIRKCYNSDLAEKVLHHILDKYRCEKNKEWFEISKELASYTINLVCDFLDKFIYCSERLPELKIKEFIDNLDIKHIDTDIVKKDIIIPTLIYNDDITNYNKFIEKNCEINDNYFCLPYDLIASYRIWCKGDLTKDIKKNFLNHIKTKYITKDRYVEEYGTRTINIIGIRPKILEFKVDNNNLKIYEKFIIDKCIIGCTYKISIKYFIENYSNWLKENSYNYIIDENEIKEYFNNKFLLTNIKGSVLGVWGLQLKTDKLPTYGIRYKETCKLIYKINVDTKEILETYNGLSEASEKLNLSIKKISDNIKFIKIYTENDLRILLKYDEETSIIFNKRTLINKNIYKFNYTTKELLNTYESLKECENKLNISSYTILKYIKSKKTLTENNNIIILSYHKNIDDITDNENNENNENKDKKIFKQRPNKQIFKINSETKEIIETFDGIIDAAVKLQIGRCTVSRYIKSGKNFIYKNDKNKENTISYILKH